MTNVVKGVGKAIGAVAPALSFIPGIGPIAAAGAGVLGGLAAGRGGLGGAFSPQVGATTNAATPAAGQYTNWLSSFMSPTDQTQGLSGIINNLLQGRTGDPTSLSQYFNAGIGGNGQANVGQAGTGYTAQPINVGYTPPAFQQAALQGINTGWNPNTVSQVQALAPAFTAPNLRDVNATTTGRESFVTDPRFGGYASLSNVTNPAANAEAIQAIMRGQQTRDIADLRERFGNRALGTGAQNAEALYRAESMPRAALAIDEITRQNNQLALTERGQNLQNYLSSRGLDTDQINTINNLLVNQRGQDIQAGQTGVNAGLAMNDQALAAAQMANQFGLSTAGLGLNAQTANQNAQLQQLQQALQAMGMGNEAILGANAQNLAQAGAQNTFNQNNAQFGANLGVQQGQLNNQFGLGAAELSQAAQIANIQAALQNAGLGNQWNLGLQGIGVDRMGQQQTDLARNQAAQIAVLQQLFGGLNQTQQLGIPQSQVTVAPSAASNVVNGIGAFGGILDVINRARGMNPGGGGINIPGISGAQDFISGIALPNIPNMPQLYA